MEPLTIIDPWAVDTGEHCAHTIMIVPNGSNSLVRIKVNRNNIAEIVVVVVVVVVDQVVKYGIE